MEAEERAAEGEERLAENVAPWPSAIGTRLQRRRGFAALGFPLCERRLNPAAHRPRKWHWLCSRIEFLATTENVDGKSPGLLVRILSDSGRWHQLAIPRYALIGGDDLLRELADHGLRFNPSGKDAAELKRLSHEHCPKQPGALRAACRLV